MQEIDRYLVVSSDGHAGLPPERYREYLDSKYHARFDAVIEAEIKKREEHEKQFLLDDFNNKWRAKAGIGLDGAWDGKIRNQVLDADGVVAEVLYPDGITERNAPPFGADVGLKPYGVEPELQWAGARAHNRWLSEFCQDDPVRRIGLAVIPAMYDMEANLKEIKWAKENGLKGVFLPSLTDGAGHKAYNHRDWWPMWKLLQDLKMPVNFHSGASPAMDATQPGWIGSYLCEYPFWLTRPMWQMIFGGVFEEFKELKVCFVEAGGEFWFPWMLQLMDIRASVKHTSGKLGDYNSNLTMKPSDYFRKHMFVGCSALPDEDSRKDYYDIGIDHIIWGTDYPHPEGTWPATREKMLASLGGLPEADLQKMLATNIIDIYDINTKPMWELAAKIGPQKASFIPKAA